MGCEGGYGAMMILTREEEKRERNYIVRERQGLVFVAKVAKAWRFGWEWHQAD